MRLKAGMNYLSLRSGLRWSSENKLVASDEAGVPSPFCNALYIIEIVFACHKSTGAVLPFHLSTKKAIHTVGFLVKFANFITFAATTQIDCNVGRP